MFVQLKDFREYFATSDGKIITTKGGVWKELTLTPAREAKYLQATLYYGELGARKRKTKVVHRLIAEAFFGKTTLQVNHLNGKKQDNRLTNLELCTPQQNSQHAWDMGLNYTSAHKLQALKARHSGENSHFSKHSDGTIEKLRALKGHVRGRDAAKMFGMSESHVSGIWSGRARAHVGDLLRNSGLLLQGKMVIYKITNTVNGLSYIGQTRNSAQHRWNQHCRKTTSLVGKAIQEFGKEMFRVEILKTCRTLHSLNLSEEYLISAHNTITPNGYNVSSGGYNYTRHPSTGAKISAALKGNTNSRGKLRSAETKARISASKKGAPLTKAQIARLSAIHRGKPWTAARRAAYEAKKVA